MKTKDISEAKDPDLRASMAALQRAALQARKTAIQTGTNLVIVKDGQLLRIRLRIFWWIAGVARIIFLRHRQRPFSEHWAIPVV